MHHRINEDEVRSLIEREVEPEWVLLEAENPDAIAHGLMAEGIGDDGLYRSANGFDKTVPGENASIFIPVGSIVEFLAGLRMKIKVMLCAAPPATPQSPGTLVPLEWS